MGERLIDTPAANPHPLGDSLLAVAGAKQLPDLLMAMNARGMAALLFLFHRRRGGWAVGKRLSRKPLCRLFEQTFVVTEELLQGVSEILVEMKSIHNVFGLRSAGTNGLAEELATIPCDDVHLGVVLEPGGTGLY